MMIMTASWVKQNELTRHVSATSTQHILKFKTCSRVVQNSIHSISKVEDHSVRVLGVRAVCYLNLNVISESSGLLLIFKLYEIDSTFQWGMGLISFQH